MRKRPLLLTSDVVFSPSARRQLLTAFFYSLVGWQYSLSTVVLEASMVAMAVDTTTVNHATTRARLERGERTNPTTVTTLAPPYWPRYGGLRHVRLLDGIWDFGQLSVESLLVEYFDSMDPQLKPSSPIIANSFHDDGNDDKKNHISSSNINSTSRKKNHTIVVPSCVDNTPPGYLGYRGVSFYRTYFDYDLTHAPARLVFQACSFYCRVWVNGIEVGDHRAGGYVSFVLDVPMHHHQQQQQQQKELEDVQDPPHPQPERYLGEEMPTIENTTTASIGNNNEKKKNYDGINELVVLVDNRFNHTSAPLHEKGDYWHYSGIMRSVELHAMPPLPSLSSASASPVFHTHVEDDDDHDIYVDITDKMPSRIGVRDRRLQHRRSPPSSSSCPSASLSPTATSSLDIWPWRLYVLPQSLSTVHLTLHLTDKCYTDKEVSGTLAFDDGPPQPFTTVGNATKNGIVDLGVMAVPDPTVWDVVPRSFGHRDDDDHDDLSSLPPFLHTVTINLNGATVTERFGLRIFGIEGNYDDSGISRITINGRVTKLVGWNHHTQWPESAASPSDQELDDDIRLLREAGTIFVRGAHYPQDPRWLDRLDEAGMVMWYETLGAGVNLHDTADPTFMKYQTVQINEMMDNALNHPSIMVWAFFNEGPSNHDEACDAYEQCRQTIKDRDGTRFVSWASDKKDQDRCLYAADVVSFNSYPGWYQPNADPVEVWTRHAYNVHRGLYPGSAGKPFLISETGAAGIYEWSCNATPGGRWTLDYQNKIIEQDVAVALDDLSISGIALWHFMDFKTFDDTENNTHCDYIPNLYPPLCSYIDTNVSRPGGLNHKGVVDFWRRKKPAYDIVSRRYNNMTLDAN